MITELKNKNNLNLTRRYLIWCYKTTKEQLDKIDRYYTQLEVDKFLLATLKSDSEYNCNEKYSSKVDDFNSYVLKKKQNVDAKKFVNDTDNLQAEYYYLKKRFEAICVAIVEYLSEDGLREIDLLYENEMTERILKTRDIS